jgi:hypothetical protein
VGGVVCSMLLLPHSGLPHLGLGRLTQSGSLSQARSVRLTQSSGAQMELRWSSGGAEEIRTPDSLRAKQVLSL